MKKFIAFAIVFFFALGVHAEEKKGDKVPADKESTATVLLSGKIIDSTTGEFLTGVEVQLEGTGQKTYTDFDGNFSFNVKPGEYNLVSDYISYEKKTEKLKIQSKENNINIRMETSR